MSNYQASHHQDRRRQLYALIVRIDRDGEENVIHGYKGRHFATVKLRKNQQTPIGKDCMSETNRGGPGRGQGRKPVKQERKR